MTTDLDAPIRFDAPGPGEWTLDTTHHGRRPLTAFMAAHYDEVQKEGLGLLFERMGLPLAAPDTACVEGCSYLRIRGIGEPDDPSGRQPPAFVLKILSRVHPELRKRNRTAAATFSERRWRTDVTAWFEQDRPALTARLADLQAIDLRLLDDAALVDHLDALGRLFHAEAVNGFAFHSDIIVVGDYLAHLEGWGIEPIEASALLRGSSPATVEVQRLLAPVGAVIRDRGLDPRSVEELRDAGPEVDEAIDRWLSEHGWRLLNSDDLDSTTLAERPDLQLAALRSTPAAPIAIPAPDASAVRQRVPAAERDRFDELLAEARFGLTLRDDHVGVRWNWPAGLLRRALLEVGRRLHDRGGVLEAEHAVELAPDEVGPLLLDKRGPSGADLRARLARRDAVEAAGPPSQLGDPAPPPPLGAFPAPLARAARAAMATIGAMEGGEPDGALAGVGIGHAPYEGTARVAVTALEALETVEPGDVLVTPYTSPSYNSLFPIVGAVVTDEGGPMSHAAIMVREFGIAGVVGVRGATRAIADGARVRVDPAAGRIELLD